MTKEQLDQIEKFIAELNPKTRSAVCAVVNEDGSWKMLSFGVIADQLFLKFQFEKVIVKEDRSRIFKEAERET